MLSNSYMRFTKKTRLARKSWFRLVSEAEGLRTICVRGKPGFRKFPRISRKAMVAHVFSNTWPIFGTVYHKSTSRCRKILFAWRASALKKSQAATRHSEIVCRRPWTKATRLPSGFPGKFPGYLPGNFPGKFPGKSLFDGCLKEFKDFWSQNDFPEIFPEIFREFPGAFWKRFPKFLQGSETPPYEILAQINFRPNFWRKLLRPSLRIWWH